MNMITQAPVADTTTMSRMPAWLTDGTPTDRPTLAWHIDATTGRAVGSWIMLPARSPRLQSV